MHAVVRSSRLESNVVLRRHERALKFGEALANGYLQDLRAIVRRAWHRLVADDNDLAMRWEMKERELLKTGVPRNSGINAPPHPVATHNYTQLRGCVASDLLVELGSSSPAIIGWGRENRVASGG